MIKPCILLLSFSCAFAHAQGFTQAVPTADGCRLVMASLRTSARSTTAFAHNEIRRVQLTVNQMPTSRLTVASWNANLFKKQYGIGRFRAGPVTQGYDVRSPRLGTILTNFLTTAEAPDVLLLQEVWMLPMDQATVMNSATAAGYLALAPDTASLPRHGLQILVRASAVRSVEGAGFEVFPRGRHTPAFEWISRTLRGLQWVKLTLTDGQTLLIGNVHLTPFARYLTARSRQLESLFATWRHLRSGVDHVVLGGDFNIAADFRAPPDRVVRLTAASRLYLRLLDGLNLYDTYRAVNRRDPGFTLNTEVPSIFGRRHDTEMRLDLILAAEQSPGAMQTVEDSSFHFAERLNEQGEPDPNGEFPSDHLMPITRLRLGRANPRP